MNFKKWLALITVFAVLLTALVGCKSPIEEESAAAGEYVESTPEEEEGQADAPVKVDPNKEPEKIQDDYDGPTDLPTDNNNNNNTPSGGNEGDTPDNNGGNEPADTPDEGDEDEEEEEVSYKEGNKLKVVSYNVRCADDGPGKMVAERGPRLEKVVKMHDPDLIGFQEVTPKWRGMLEGYFGDQYDYVYQERSPGGECTPVFWKRDKFEKKAEGHFWLSETPDTSSIGFGGQHYRVCSWVRLKNKATGTEFLYFNTHFDFSAEQHVPSAKLMLNRAKAAGGFTKYGVIFTADWNMNPWKPGYNAIVESGDMSDINYDLENLSDGTCNGYNEGDGGGGSIIDMCFYSPAKIIPLDYKVINEKIDGGWVSDHRGIYMEMALK